MNSIIKSAILNIPYARQIITFVKQTPQPADHVLKQQVIIDLATKYGTRTFVESGTYMGDMVEAMKSRFDVLYSIELDDALFESATDRFQADGNVKILHGDSGEKLAEIMPQLSGPTLFWLDGHYSGGVTALGTEATPIYAELRHILSYPDIGHVILIDDARLFGTDLSYPKVEEVAETVLGLRPSLEIDVQNDAIRIMPSAK